MVYTGMLPVCLVVSEGINQGFKKHFAFILVYVSPSSMAPPASRGTGNPHVPSSKISSCSITLVRPTKPRDTAVLQVIGLHDFPGTDFLPFLPAHNSLSKTTTLQNILVSIPCILCKTELYLTLPRGYSGAPATYSRCQKRAAHVRKEKTHQGWKEKKNRCVRWPNARSTL